MEIVIKIDAERYNDIQRITEVQFESNYFKTAEQIIANGTPLPEGHGRLIDADALNFNADYNEPLISKLDFDNAPTIIEADTE